MPSNADAVFESEDLVTMIISFGQLEDMLPIMGRLNWNTRKVWLGIEQSHDQLNCMNRRRKYFQVLINLSQWLGFFITPDGPPSTVLSLASSLENLIKALGPLMLTLWPQRGVSGMIDPRGGTLFAYAMYGCNGGTADGLSCGVTNPYHLDSILRALRGKHGNILLADWEILHDLDLRLRPNGWYRQDSENLNAKTVKWWRGRHSSIAYQISLLRR